MPESVTTRNVAGEPAGPRIIVALDAPDAQTALRWAGAFDPRACRLKVGLELFTRAGPAIVERLQRDGFEIFLDLKFHDIPNTVAAACRAAAALGVWMVNVHAGGGRAMLEAARAVVGEGDGRPLLVAVTVLTSLDDAAVAEIGWGNGVAAQVERLTALALAAGLDGVVCSPLEVQAIRARHGRAPVLVTPGVRPAGSARGDQKRVVTPAEAVRAGADYLVVGRPITQAPDPAAALAEIQRELDA